VRRHVALAAEAVLDARQRGITAAMQAIWRVQTAIAEDARHRRAADHFEFEFHAAPAAMQARPGGAIADPIVIEPQGIELLEQLDRRGPGRRNRRVAVG